MKKIVILGGCGYIGSELFTYLNDKNYHVDTVDVEWFGNYINQKNIKRDYSELSKGFFNKYDVVVLLAGHSTVGMCDKDIEGSLKNNVDNFVSLMSKLKRQKFIYASTYRLYDGIIGHPVEESENYREPSSIYCLTKKTIDYYSSFSQLEFYSLRMATINGYSPNLRTNQIINKLFLNSKEKKKISIFDPDAVFSVLGINDLCRGIEQIILGGDQRGIYNLASFDSNIYQITQQLSTMFKGVEISVKNTPKNRYHMQIATDKFQKTYNFAFHETVRSILISLKKNFSQRTHKLQSI